MKRFAFLMTVLIVIASTTGCRRGLRLWGMRGAPCTPTCSPVPGPVYSPAVVPQAAPCPCPPTTTYVQPPPIDCGCATQGVPYDPAYSGAPLGYQLGPGETFGGDVVQGSVPPAELPPNIPYP